MLQERPLPARPSGPLRQQLRGSCCRTVGGTRTCDFLTSELLRSCLLCRQKEQSGEVLPGQSLGHVTHRPSQPVWQQIQDDVQALVQRVLLLLLEVLEVLEEVQGLRVQQLLQVSDPSCGRSFLSGLVRKRTSLTLLSEAWSSSPRSSSVLSPSDPTSRWRCSIRLAGSRVRGGQQASPAAESPPTLQTRLPAGA